MVEAEDETVVVVRVVRVVRVPDVAAGTGGAAAFFLPFAFLEGLGLISGEDRAEGNSVGEVDFTAAPDLGTRGSPPLFHAASSSGVAMW